MSAIQQVKKIFVGFVLLSSLLAKGFEAFPKAEFGVVKSRDQIVFLSCVEQTSEGKKCFLYQQKKGEKAEAISHEMLLVNLKKNSEAVSGVLHRLAKDEFNPAVLLPITSVAIVFAAVGGPKYIPLLLLAPLDLAAGPVALMADGCRRLYRLIQGTYLKKAWKTVSGLGKRGSMRLSRKDFEDFVNAVKKSAI